MEATDEIKVEGTEVMPTTIPDPPEIWGVEAMRTSKGNPSRNAGTVARRATGKASAGRSAPIRREPGQANWAKPTETELDGLNIRLIGNELKEVRWIELQLLEGANAGLPYSRQSPSRCNRLRLKLSSDRKGCRGLLCQLDI